MGVPTLLSDRLGVITDAVAAFGDEAARRERDHIPPVDQLSELLEAGLGRLRVPTEFGGAGESVVTLAEALIAVAAADSNLAQIFRGHLGLTEILRQTGLGRARSELLTAAAEGKFFGPAGGEVNAANLTTLAASLRREGGGLYLTGRKYYTTGSLYADWLNVLVIEDEEFVSVLVPANCSGVCVVDDWDGFGQRLTASGTTVFDQVPVDPDFLIHHRDRLTNDYMDAFYQFVHSATQAGIARAIANDVTTLVNERVRSYPLATTSKPAQDPQVVQIVGELHAKAFATHATVLALARSLDAFNEDRSETTARQTLIDSAAAQVINTELVGDAAWRLFDAGSASALKSTTGLDRHWRNARTVSSHNPAIYKAGLIGDYAVNGTEPKSFLNTVGDRPSRDPSDDIEHG